MIVHNNIILFLKQTKFFPLQVYMQSYTRLDESLNDLDSSNQIIPVSIKKTPSTDEYSVIFPYASTKDGFISTLYDASQTNNRASSSEIQTVVRKLNEIHKPFAYAEVFLRTFSFLLVCVSVLITLYVILTEEAHLSMLQTIGVLFILLILALVMFFANKIVKEDSRSRVQNHLNAINAEYSQRGLKWLLPVHYPKWIELDKDYMPEECLVCL